MTPEPPPGGELFDVVAFLVASARDVLEAPAAYGAFRLLDGAARLATIVDGDPFLDRLATTIDSRKHLIMSDRARFVEAVDEVLGEVASEAKRRNFATPADGEKTD
jgi:hypothetical protein